jgi:hypothetical protein
LSRPFRRHVSEETNTSLTPHNSTPPLAENLKKIGKLERKLKKAQSRKKERRKKK